MIIYKITNTINGKVYIGKTTYTKEKRFKEHISDSIKPNMKHRPLYRAFNKYGIENFTIEEIDQAKDDKEACQLEQKWILFYNSYHFYYIDNNGNKVCFKSTLEAAKIIAPNINPESARKNISRALTHNKSAYGYYWKYLDD